MEMLLTALRAAGEPTRMRILTLLAVCDLTVTEIAQILGQSQPRVSRHLKLLTDAGLVRRYQEGSWAFYRGAEEGLPAAIAGKLVSWVPEADPIASADRRRLDAVRRARRRAAAAYFQRIAERWDRIRGLRVDEARVEQAMLNLAQDRLDGDLLDLGTGTGRILEIFADKVRQGIGIDQSRDMLSVARTKLDDANVRNCHVRLGDIYNLAVPDGCADLVTVHQVLHYLDDPASAIAEAVRALRPRGRLIIVDFAAHDIEFLRTEYAHRRLGFTDEEVIGWCEQAGLTAVDIDHLVPREERDERQLTVSIWSGLQRADAPAHYSLEVA